MDWLTDILNIPNKSTNEQLLMIMQGAIKALYSQEEEPPVVIQSYVDMALYDCSVGKFGYNPDYFSPDTPETDYTDQSSGKVLRFPGTDDTPNNGQ